MFSEPKESEQNIESELKSKSIHEIEQLSDVQVLKHLSILGEDLDFNYIKTCLFDNCSIKDGSPLIFNIVSNDKSGNLTKMFLTILNRLLQKSTQEVVNFLMISDIFHFSICHKIARYQNESINIYLLELLTRLSVEHTEKVLDIFTQLDNQGDSIGHIVVSKQSEVVNNKFLGLLSTLAKIYPWRVVELLLQVDDQGNRIGSYIANNQNAVINNYFWDLLVTISKVDPEKFLDTLKSKDSTGQSIGVWITQNQNTIVNVRFLDLLSDLSCVNPEKVLDILTSIGHLVASKQSEVVSVLFLDILAEFSKDYPERVLDILTQVPNVGYDIGHLLVFQPSEVVSNQLCVLMLVLAENYPNRVYNYINSKVRGINQSFLDFLLKNHKTVVINTIKLVEKLDNEDLNVKIVTYCAQINFQDNLFQEIQNKPEEMCDFLRTNKVAETILKLPTSEQRTWRNLSVWKRWSTSKPQKSYLQRVERLMQTNEIESKSTNLTPNILGLNANKYEQNDTQNGCGVRQRNVAKHTKNQESANHHELKPLLSEHGFYKYDKSESKYTSDAQHDKNQVNYLKR